MKKIKQYSYIILPLLLIMSCQQAYLDAKPDKALLVPSSLKDFRALSDNLIVYNNAPALNVLSTDEFSTSQSGWNSYRTAAERNSYIWASDVYEGAILIPDWNNGYQQIFYSNVILEGLANLNVSGQDQQEYQALKGTALFTRGFAYAGLLKQFAAPYQAATAESEQGIPLKLQAAIDENATSPNLKICYDQVLSDLEQSIWLLPKVSSFRTRPVKQAALTMLARVHLDMAEYTKALSYANQALAISSKLLDYNSLSISSANPFPLSLQGSSNPEVIYYAILNNYGFRTNQATVIDAGLLPLYKTGDLRRTHYYITRSNGAVNFKGNYSGSNQLFGGLAIDELYLIKAECLVRQNEIAQGMQILNALLEKRYTVSTFTPQTTTDQQEALKLIISERRKELIARGLRWADLRRLNNEANLATTLTRNLNNTTYTLSPGGKGYIFPIPDYEKNGRKGL